MPRLYPQYFFWLNGNNPIIIAALQATMVLSHRLNSWQSAFISFPEHEWTGEGVRVSVLGGYSEAPLRRTSSITKRLMYSISYLLLFFFKDVLLVPGTDPFFFFSRMLYQSQILRDKMLTLVKRDTLLRTRPNISVLFENSRGKRANRFGIYGH